MVPMVQIAAIVLLLPMLAAAAEPPESWIDPDTGHRVVRLTKEPGSASLYFNQNGYTADSKHLVYTTPGGISILHLETREARQVVTGRVRMIDAGRKHPRVYYTRDGAAWWTDYHTGESRKIADLPRRGGIATVNADETLLAGTYIEGEGRDYNNQRPARPAPAASQAHSLDQPRNKGQMMEDRLAARLPMAMFTVHVETGETRVIHRATDWLNHLLFSPTDPTLLMFCHEGPGTKSTGSDHPHRRLATHQDPHAPWTWRSGATNSGVRTAKRLVRPPDAARRGLLARGLRGRDRAPDLVPPRA